MRRLDERGQSTVEFALIMAGFASVMMGLAALAHAFGDGLFVQHALATASHHIQGVSPVVAADIFLY